jgi:hypothetical protein
MVASPFPVCCCGSLKKYSRNPLPYHLKYINIAIFSIYRILSALASDQISGAAAAKTLLFVL